MAGIALVGRPAGWPTGNRHQVASIRNAAPEGLNKMERYPALLSTGLCCSAHENTTSTSACFALRKLRSFRATTTPIKNKKHSQNRIYLETYYNQGYSRMQDLNPETPSPRRNL